MDTEIMGSETVYGNDISDEDAHVMSDRVQSVATNIYREFERMIPSYGEDVVKEMMPHIVTILENLDQAYKENQEKDAELELCKDDNEQLMTQYEREKQLRKSTDQKLMAIEDQMEEERKETNGEIESLKLTVRTYELKAKNSQDHILRLEDKEAEWKREYGKVHEQYTELLKKHMEHVEKSKLLMGAERMFDMGAAPRKNFQMPNLRHIAAGGGIHSPDVTRSGYETSQFALVSPVVTKNMSVSLDNELSDYGRAHQNVETETAEKDMNTETVQVYERGTGTSSILSPTSDEFADNSRNKYDKPLKTNDQELSSIYDELVEVDDDDGFTGMSKEVENLILENTELLSTKNALNVVKDDLIARVDELISEQEIMREEMKANNVLKDKLRSQVSELETELKKCKETLETERKKISPDEDQKDDLSMAQRKRFTRVEMARVLMERNQYKERLMELQEAVRWTEMIRASREHPDLLPGFQNAKKKSTIWNYFEKLLNKQPKKISTMPTVRYNAPTGQSKSNNPSPQHREKPRMNEKKADFLQDELLTEKKRKELEQDRKEQYKQVRAHVKKEDGRMQAYGWSVPAKSSMAASKEHQPTSKVSKSPMPVPVPVYCKPLSEDDTSIKVWCAAGVCDLLAGETPSNILDQVNTGTTDVYQSRIWICTTNENKSFVTVVDANNPSNPLDKFIVSMEHVLCITFVPGSKNADPVPQVNIKCSPSNQTENNNGDGVEDSGVSLVKCTSYTELPDSSASSEGSSADIPPETSNVTLHQSTMWLGMQNGCVFVHSVTNNWKERVFATRLPDSVLSISHIGSRVFIALANGSLAVFCRSPADRAWDMSQYYLMQLGKPQHSIRCQCIVDDRYVWCGYRNKVLIVNPEVLALEKTFDAHPRIESQIRQMVWAGDGVWVSIRLDSTLRLYHAVTHQHLQDVDIEPYVSKMLGTGKLGFSFIRITSLLAACNRLWIGTGNGVIICVPLFEGNRQTMMTSSITGRQLPGGGVYRIYNDVTSDTGEPAINTTCVPYCSMAQAQLSFHGHKDAVKFFVAVPAPPSDARQSCDIDDDKKLGDANTSPTMLVMSGGEGYVDFRLGVGNSSAEEDEDRESKARKDAEAGQGRAYLSHLIVWQVYQNSSSSSS